MKVVKNQNLVDIAVQESGSALSALDWALANNLSITEEILVGKVLLKSNSLTKNDDIVNYFKNRKQLIATDYDATLLQPIGIGTMAIGTTFIIN